MEIKDIQEMKQILQDQEQILSEQVQMDLFLTNVFASFMQKHVSGKYFIVNAQYGEEIMRCN